MRRLWLVAILALLIIVSMPTASAWLDASYTNRFPINCSADDTGMQIVVNGTYGVTLNGSTFKQIIWTKCQAGLYLYYTNFTNYMVGTDTAYVNFEVEIGNASSVNASAVWGNDYIGVWHLSKNCTDSGINNIPCAISGTPPAYRDNASCAIGGCYWFTKSDTVFFNLSTQPYTRFETGDIQIEYYGVWVDALGSGVLLGNGRYTTAWLGTHFEENGLPHANAFYASNNAQAANSNVNLVDYTMYSWVGWRNASAAQAAIFRNGINDTSSWSGGVPLTNATGTYSFYIGRNADVTYPRGTTGSVDELRISNKSRSKKWINDTYSNYLAIAGHGTLGATESGGGGGIIPSITIAQNAPGEASSWTASPNIQCNVTLVNDTINYFQINLFSNDGSLVFRQNKTFSTNITNYNNTFTLPTTYNNYSWTCNATTLSGLNFTTGYRNFTYWIAPTNFSVPSPLNTTYGGQIVINWTASAPYFIALTQYNVSLLYSNGTFIQNLINVSSTTLNYTTCAYNLSMVNASFIAQVQAIDSRNMSTTNKSLTFSTNYVNHTIKLNNPTNITLNALNSSVIFRCNVTKTSDTALTVNMTGKTPIGELSDIKNITTNGVYSLVLNGSYCYQETANVSTLCGGLNTGSYTNSTNCPDTGSNQLSYAWDGNWTTAASASFGTTCSIYINYSKPPYSTSSSLWQIDNTVGISNVTIPIGCWNQAQLQFKRNSLSPALAQDFCYNGSGWQLISDNDANWGIIEDAMYWHINNTLDLGQGYSNFTCTQQSATCTLGDIQSGTWQVYQDSIVPTIAINQPTAGYIFNTTTVPITVKFNYTAADSAARDQCWYVYDGQAPVSMPGCANQSLSITTFGLHNFTAFVNDTVNNIVSASVMFQVGSFEVNLNLPADGAYANNSLVNFSCIAVNHVGNVTAVSVWVLLDSGWADFVDRTGLSQGTYQLNATVDFSAEPDMNYSWYCRAEDDPLTTWDSPTWTFILDRIPPVIELIAPVNYTGYAMATPAVNITFNVIDANPFSCNLTIFDFALNEQLNYTNCNNLTDPLSGATNGEYEINISVNDSAGNRNRLTSRFAVGSIVSNFTGAPINLYNFSFHITGFTLISPTAICTIGNNYTYVNPLLEHYVVCGYTNTTSFNSVTNNINCTLNTNVSDVSNIVDLWVSCRDGLYEFNTTHIATWVDITAPIFASLFPDNGKTLYSRNTTGQVGITDTNLFRINATIDGVPWPGSELSDINTTDYQFNFTRSVTTLKPGAHVLKIAAWDSHTSAEIEAYSVSKPILSNAITYDTGTNKIKIDAVDEGFNIANPFSTTKLIDRYSFAYKPSEAQTTYTFQVTTDQPMYVLDKPDSKWKTWIVSGDNWVDFYTPDTTDNVVSIEKVDDYTANVVVSKSVAIEQQPIGKDGKIVPVEEQPKIQASEPISLNDDGMLVFSSIGDLNYAQINYTFYTVNATLTYIPAIIETQTQSSTLTINTSGIGQNYSLTFDWYDTTFHYYNYTVSGSNTTTILNNATFSTPNVATTLTAIGSWRLNLSGENVSINYSQLVYDMGVTTNCSTPNSSVVLTLWGKDEQNNATIQNMSVNMDIDIWVSSQILANNMHFAFRLGNNYSICVYPNTTIYQIYSILEYGGINGYTDRKYYLFNMTLNASSPRDVILYHLNTSSATVVTYNIINRQTGENVPNAYLKILRYYPELNEYLLVELEKTDENGRTITKMIPYDVFYKEIVEYPNGIQRLSTEVSKLVSSSKTLAIPLGTDLMGDFVYMSGTNVKIGCNKNSFLCNTSWSTTDGSVRTIEMRVYESTGVSRTLLNTTLSTPSASGQIYFTVPSPKNNTNYIAEAYIIGSEQLAASASMNNQINIFSTQANLRVASLIPLLLLTISIICALLDIGVVGVVVGSMTGVIVGMATTIIPVNIPGIVSLVILGVILIYKMVK